LNFMGMQLANPEPKLKLLQERLNDSLSLVEQTADRIRDVMSELRPPMLDDYGLVDALEWYGQRFGQRMQLEVTVQGYPFLSRLDPGTENTLFRITQEALNNVAKHAQATEVTISVFEDNHKIRLVILDNGIGFDPARRSEGSRQFTLGLLTMVERAEAVGGVCQIETQPGRGTRVLVEVPL
jgi:two-component system sensor histidine kinase UhpB